MKQAISGKALRGKTRHFVTCPETGNTYLMRRPNITHLINSGALPENFVAKTLQVLGREIKPESNELTDADLLKGEAVMRAMVTAAMLQPRIVENATTDDECEFYDIPRKIESIFSSGPKANCRKSPLRLYRARRPRLRPWSHFLFQRNGANLKALSIVAHHWWQTQPITRTM
jgi:hypothetical protein